MRRQSRGFEDSSSSSFVFCGGGIGLPSGLGVLVHVLIRRLPQRRNVAISISRSLWWSHCTQTAAHCRKVNRQRRKKDVELRALIVQSIEQSRNIYGSPRV